MADLNKTTLIGNVVRDPQPRALPSGQTVVRFSLATNYAWQDARTKVKREAVDFHNVVARGKLGEIIVQYVHKGAKIYVEGRLRQRTATAKDGARRTTTEIVADNMIMLGRRSSPERGQRAAESRLVREDVDVEDGEEA
jgi:single-strand DNA-binding protein